MFKVKTVLEFIDAQGELDLMERGDIVAIETTLSYIIEGEVISIDGNELIVQDVNGNNEVVYVDELNNVEIVKYCN